MACQVLRPVGALKLEPGQFRPAMRSQEKKEKPMTTSKPLGVSAAIATVLFLGLVNNSDADDQLYRKSVQQGQIRVSFASRHHFAKYYHRRRAIIVASPVMDTGLGSFSGTGDGSAGSWAPQR